MSPRPAPTAPFFAVLTTPLAFSRDLVLASGPSAAWLDAERWAPPPQRRPVRAAITGCIEHG